MQKHLFDYSDVPQMLDVVQRYGIAPFATLLYKATVDVLLPTLAKKPSC